MKVVFIGIFLALFVLSVSINSVDASSFPRQEITDPNYNDKFGGEMPDGYGFGDLSTITYVSDGETLDVTYFLREPISIDSKVSYAILFDADSNALTGDGGIDYIYKKTLDEKQWKIDYLSITRQGTSSEIFSTIEPFENSDAKDSVRLIVDLKKFRYLENYVSSFVSQVTLDDGTITQDSSHVVIIPPSSFELKTIPSELKLSPGEKQFVTVKISSDSNLPYKIIQLNEKSDNGIVLKSVDEGPFMLENGIVLIHAEIEVPQNIDYNFYSIPVTFKPFFDRHEIVDINQVDLDIVEKSLYNTNIPHEKFEVSLNVVYDPIDNNLIVILGAIIAGILTFAGTKWTSRGQYNAQLSKVHFDDLKEHVVKPLIEYFQLWKNVEIGQELVLKKQDDLKGETNVHEYIGGDGWAPVGQNFNYPLLEDLLQNHYPTINKKWKNSVSLNEKYSQTRDELFQLIMQKIQSEFDKKYDLQNTDVGYLSDDPEHLAGTRGTIVLDSLTKKIFSAMIRDISFDKLKIGKSEDHNAIFLDHESFSKRIIIKSS